MSLASPLYLLTLLVVPVVLALTLAINRRRARYPVSFTNLDLLAGVLHERRRLWRRWVPLALLLLALATAAAALARPHAHVSVWDEHATVVFLVDVSGSMRADDVEPTRLDAAVAAMRTFLGRLPPRVKVGLVVFSSAPEVIQTPTRDRQALLSALAYLQPEAGTALGDGLAAAVRVTVASLKRDGVQRVPGRFLPAAIVLESDGAQNRGALEPLQAAALAKRAGIRVDGVALGTPKGTVSFGFGVYVNKIPVPPDPQTVRMISHVTGGVAFTARNSNRLDSIYRKLGSSIGREVRSREITSWFAVAAAVLLVAAFSLARVWAAPLP